MSHPAGDAQQDAGTSGTAGATPQQQAPPPASTLDQQVAALLLQVNNLQAAALNSQNNFLNAGKIRMKEPEVFDGSRDPTRRKVSNFLSQCELYFLAYPAFDTDDKKLAFAASYCRGDAYTWVSSYFNADKTKPEFLWLATWAGFRKKMESVFGDSDPVGTNARRLSHLRQTGAASEYAAEFRRLSLLLGWNDQALRFHFYQGLKDSVKDELILEDEFEDLDKLVEAAVKIDDRIFLRSRERRTTDRSVSSTFTRTPRANTTSNGRSSTTRFHGYGNTSNSNNNGTSTPSSWNGVPPHERMEIDANRRNTIPRGPLTQAEKDRRRANGLCSYCAQHGHFADKCPILLARQQAGTSAPSSSTPRMRTAAATFTISSANATPLGSRTSDVSTSPTTTSGMPALQGRPLSPFRAHPLLRYFYVYLAFVNVIVTAFVLSTPLYGKIIPTSRIYPLSASELDVLAKYVEDNLRSGFIRPSTSPVGAPILFVKKKDGTLRLCVDYRNLNSVTLKNKYPLPLISEALDRLSGAKFFTKIDALVNDAFRPFLDIFVVCYLDDILIYSQNEEQHIEHVKLVLDQMRKKHLYAKLSKCEFHSSSVEYLGYIVNREGIMMDPSKIASIRSWPTPEKLQHVQSFLGFTNFYRRFIKDYSKLTAPLTRFTKKGVKFEWDNLAIAAFSSLKDAFEVLSQRHDGRLHPVAFHSRRLDPAKLNYEIFDKELLSIIEACKFWRPYLENTASPFKIWSDHFNLTYFFSSRTLNRRQARWYLQMYYAVGSKADESLPVLFFPPSRIVVNTVTTDPFPSLEQHILDSQDDDDDIRQVLQDYRLSENLERYTDLKWSLDSQGILRWDNRIYIPNDHSLRLRVVRLSHDSPSSGHPGIDKTFDRFRRSYYFPQDQQWIRNYVSTCDSCFRAKSRREKPHGLLQPLPAPTRPWRSIAMDFIVKLPTTRSGFDSIFVCTDRFTKMAHFIPCNEEGLDAAGFASMFYKSIFPLHGLPADIVSDRGSLFSSDFWSTLSRLTRVSLNLSTAYHPQTDGATERLNQTLEQYLRIYTSYSQDDWDELLPLAMFVYNDTVHSSTKTTPFYANYGFHPSFNVDFNLENDQRPLDASASSLADRLNSLHQILRNELELTASCMKKYYDLKRKDAPSFVPGDKVWLSTRNIVSTRQSKKLDHHYIGPFPVVSRVGDLAYKLDLPATLRIHPVFHIGLLHPHKENSIPDRLPQIPPLTIVNGEAQHEVEHILKVQTYHGHLRYLVRWRGLPPSEDGWEYAEALDNAAETVASFHRDHPSAPTTAAAQQSGCLKNRGNR
ncbi:hypothetical protein JCM6882_006265 [Rhodosporidiobolus microsporus]